MNYRKGNNAFLDFLAGLENPDVLAHENVALINHAINDSEFLKTFLAEMLEQNIHLEEIKELCPELWLQLDAKEITYNEFKEITNQIKIRLKKLKD